MITEEEILAWLRRKYTQSQDRRQKKLDLIYINAETHDLAKELVKYANRGLRPDQVFKIDHDGFIGRPIGVYTTHEGKRGVVLQQVGTRVVHVYGEKWIK